MTDLKNKKISRRDAIKLLGAAVGASALANLPSKWSKPSFARGVLPVHAQTSVMLDSIQSCSGAILCPDSFLGESVSVIILSGTAGISMTYNITTNGNTLLGPATGTVLTDATGTAILTVFLAQNNPSPTSATLDWSFTNPADGAGTCQTVFNWDNSCNN